MVKDKDKSLIMAKRLRDLRTQRGLSYEALKQILMEIYETDISIDSLKNYEVAVAEHTKAYKNQGMRIEYLRCLADFYGVSSDYLLGISDIRSPNVDTRKIAEVTGLSEIAIEVLMSLHSRSQNSVSVRNIIATVNLLLENADERKTVIEVIPLLEYISAYLHCAPDTEQVVSVETDGTVRIFSNIDAYENAPGEAIAGDYLRQIIKSRLEQRVLRELQEMWNEKNAETRKEFLARMIREEKKRHK